MQSWMCSLQTRNRDQNEPTPDGFRVREARNTLLRSQTVATDLLFSGFHPDFQKREHVLTPKICCRGAKLPVSILMAVADRRIDL